MNSKCIDGSSCLCAGGACESKKPFVCSKNDLILLYVRAPVQGQVKTRLAKAIGASAALQLYRCFVSDMLATLEACRLPVQVCYSPPTAEAALKAWLGPAFRYQPQPPGPLGHRMAETFRRCFAQGTVRALLIGTDIPDLPGEIVRAALAALRKSFANARISWLVRPEFAPLLENHPFIDEIILFDRKYLGKAFYHPKAFGQLYTLIKQLRSRKFDAIFDFQGLLRTASLAWLSGCKKRYGIANAREMAHIFYTDKIEHNLECIHLVDLYLKMVQTAGANIDDV